MWLHTIKTASVCFLGSAALFAHDIRVRLEPTTTVFNRADDVEFRILIENASEPCIPILLDSYLDTVAVPLRPGTILVWHISDAHGKELTPVAVESSHPRGLLPAELIRLGCGGYYGRRLSLTNGTTRFSLKKGRYRVRATVQLRTRSFLRQRPELAQAVSSAWSIPPDDLGAELVDGEFHSPEIEIEIRRDR